MYTTIRRLSTLSILIIVLYSPLLKFLKIYCPDTRQRLFFWYGSSVTTRLKDLLIDPGRAAGHPVDESPTCKPEPGGSACCYWNGSEVHGTGVAHDYGCRRDAWAWLLHNAVLSLTSQYAASVPHVRLTARWCMAGGSCAAARTPAQ